MYSGTFLFKSSDAGAPTINNTAGKLTDLLQAIFVDGYNALTTGLTIARTGSVATVTRTAHGFQTGQIVRNAGWDQAEYNIDAKVTRIDANNYSYVVAGTPTTPGTAAVNGTAKMCPLDWTAFGTPGTNHRAWQQPAGTLQRWLSVWDHDTANSYAYAHVRGYETLTTLTTTLPDADGTGPFPTAAQQAGGLFVDKSNAATLRDWYLVSNRKMFHLLILHAGASTARTGLSFGDFTSYKAGTDSASTLIAASTSAGGGQAWNLASATSFPTTSTGLFFHKTHTGLGGAVVGCKPALTHVTGGGIVPGAGSTIPYPAPIGGGLLLQRMVVAESTAVLDFRGHMPGLWWPWQAGMTALDTFTGAVGSTIAGRSFLVVPASGNGGIVLFETSDTWD